MCRATWRGNNFVACIVPTGTVLSNQFINCRNIGYVDVNSRGIVDSPREPHLDFFARDLHPLRLRSTNCEENAILAGLNELLVAFYTRQVHAMRYLCRPTFDIHDENL